MRQLTFSEFKEVSGAELGAFVPDYTYQWTVPEPAPSTDPVAIAIQAAAAFAIGCIGGAVRGGAAGCVIGGTIGAAGKTVSMLLEDAYDTWKAQQKA